MSALHEKVVSRRKGSRIVHTQRAATSNDSMATDPSSSTSGGVSSVESGSEAGPR